VSVNTNRVVVIGGGIIGAMCAWELSSAGCDVTVVDRGRFGGACSHGNCGYVSPSHVLPLTRPGAVTSTIKAMMKPNSPFAIKPRFSRNSLSWFWNFARRCNQADMLAAAVGIHELLQSSKSIYQELIANEAIECEWQECGLLFVYDSSKEFEAYEQTDKLIQEHFGVAATPYATKELVELEPALKPVVAGAWYYDCDCHLRPDKLLAELKRMLAARGVQIIENVAIESFASEHQTVRAAKGDKTELEADQFVVATGAWTPMLNRQLGCRIPIEPGKGYSLTMPTPRQMPRIPIIFEDAHVAITPMETRYRIGSTMEFVGYNTSIHPKKLGLLRAAAEKYLHDPFCEPVE
jgi:D-amino-acid dehydrogenase